MVITRSRRGGDSLLRDPDGERGFLRRRGYNRPSGGKDEDELGVDYNEDKGGGLGVEGGGESVFKEKL